MNIFVLDLDLKKCAESHLAPYKRNHVNHPCSKWSRESLSNWLWLRELGKELYNECQQPATLKGSGL